MTVQSLNFSLVSRPSFWEGMARVLDLGATLQVPHDVGPAADADAQALFSDWLAIGDDIRTAMSQYGERESRSAR